MQTLEEIRKATLKEVHKYALTELHNSRKLDEVKAYTKVLDIIDEKLKEME